MPVHAQETTNTYQVSYKNEESVSSLIQSLYSKKIGTMQQVASKDHDLAYESNSYQIYIDGLDLEQEGNQDVTFTLSSKQANGSNVKVDASSLTATNKMSLAKSGSTVVETQSIEVKDTVAPTLTIPTEDVTVNQGSTFDPKNYVQATDDKDKEVNITYTGNVDTNTVGTYTVQASATDAAGNTSKQSFHVNVVSDAYYDSIAQAAINQVGVNQDCTMLVTNSLKAVGIDFHGWPSEYATLGTVTENPVPGDIVIYQGHVALYIGNGQAVHGGWLGNSTVISTVECSNAFVAYVHVNKV